MNELEKEYKRTMDRFDNVMSKKDSDEWGTPDDLYKEICIMTGTKPRLDVAANAVNTRCDFYFADSLTQDWLIEDHHYDVWCNAPGKLISKFVKKAVDQWIRHSINIVMLVPVNTITNKSFQIVWDLFLNDKIDIIPLFGTRPHFLWNNQKSEYGSRNGYIVVHFKKW